MARLVGKSVLRLRKRSTAREKTRHLRGTARRAATRMISLERPKVPGDYQHVLGRIKARIQKDRLRAVFTANSAMVLLYWDIGHMILERQHRSGWGAKIIERLSGDLRAAYPDMKGFSPRNLKYMRAFTAAWPDRAIVQGPLAQISWYHNLTLLEKLSTENNRLWYARQAIKNGWSQSGRIGHGDTHLQRPVPV